MKSAQLPPTQWHQFAAPIRSVLAQFLPSAPTDKGGRGTLQPEISRHQSLLGATTRRNDGDTAPLPAGRPGQSPRWHGVRTRTAEGRVRAKGQGQHMGRPSKLTNAQRVEARERR
jgi:hypothetical protein